MPHTSHRKKKQPIAKRIEVLDEDGWTRVTSTNRNQKDPKRAENPQGPIEADLWKTIPEEGASADKTRGEYTHFEKRWKDSDAHEALTTLLRHRVLADGRHIDKCIMFGSASFCGLREGWISMKGAAMSQLAAFKSMHNTIEKVTGVTVPVYAQDPAYNDIDIEFLKLVGIDVVQHPRGFDKLTSKSLAYTPGAELYVELRTLSAKPAIRLGSKLDFYWRTEQGTACTDRVTSREVEAVKGSEYTPDGAAQQARTTGTFESVEDECRCFEAFLHDREQASVPQFEVKDGSAFRDQHLYWLKSLEDGEATNEAPSDSMKPSRQD